MRFACISLFILLASGLFFDATPLYAAHDGGLIPCHGPDCRACDLVVFGQRLLTWFIGTMASVIALIFAWGGMKMVMSAGNTEGVSEAKGMMTNSVIGFIILLGAWLIVDTVMKVVISKDSVVQSKLGTWNQIECVPMPERVAGGGGGVVVSPGAGGGVTAPPTNGGLSEEEVKKQLAGIPIVSSGQCSDPTNRSCTGLAGLQQDSLNEIKGTINSCSGCNLQITAGTETGHKNECHESGTCVDVDCQGGCSVSQIRSLVSSARSNGVRAVYEVKTETRRQELIRAGVPASDMQTVSWITGEHASLYTK